MSERTSPLEWVLLVVMFCFLALVILGIRSANNTTIQRLEKHYHKGFDAGLKSLPIHAAPEMYGDQWKEGWRDAQTDQPRKFDLEDYR